MRVKFQKGKQKEFLNNCISNLNSTSLNGMLEYGISSTTSSLKNYYSERRLLPESLFEELCRLAKIPKENLIYEIIEEDWGKSKGGKKSKRKKLSFNSHQFLFFSPIRRGRKSKLNQRKNHRTKSS
jgi:hypothetical protein